jgi:hypothetical protein
MEGSKRGFLPIMKGVPLSVTQCLAIVREKSVMANITYASAIGSIMYAKLSTRPDVVLALRMMNGFQSNPGVSHWTIVKNILKYLRRIKDMVLVYGRCGVELDGKVYVDVCYNTNPDDKKSQPGYMMKE